MDALKILLTDSRWWAAVIALLNAVIYYFWPDFPATIWAAFNALVAVVLAVLATNGTVTKTRELRASRALNASVPPDPSA
jgi:MFS superfamily sulfate permease-like transporter